MVCERSAEMNPQLRLLQVKSEAESVPGHSIRIENITSVNKHDITVQPQRKRIDSSDAKEMTQRVRRFALKREKLAEPETKRLVERYNPSSQIRFDVAHQLTSYTDRTVSVETRFYNP